MNTIDHDVVVVDLSPRIFETSGVADELAADMNVGSTEEAV